MPWAGIGRVSFWVLAWLTITAGLAILKYEWPAVMARIYETVVHTLIVIGLAWLIVWRPR